MKNLFVIALFLIPFLGFSQKVSLQEIQKYAESFRPAKGWKTVNEIALELKVDYVLVEYAIRALKPKKKIVEKDNCAIEYYFIRGKKKIDKID